MLSDANIFRSYEQLSGPGVTEATASASAVGQIQHSAGGTTRTAAAGPAPSVEFPSAAGPDADERSDHRPFIRNRSPRHASERLLSSACCGLPPLWDGRLHARRLRRLLEFFAHPLRRPRGGLPGVQFRQCQTAEQQPTRLRFRRALRPSICRLPFRNRIPAVGRLRRSDGRSRQQPTKEGEKRLYGRRRFRKSSFWRS